MTSGCFSSTSITWARLHVGLGETRGLELVVAGAHEGDRIVGDRVEDAFERRPVGRRVEIAHDLRVDTALLEDLRARRATCCTTGCGRSAPVPWRADASNRRYSPRPTSTAPSERRWGVVHCTSKSVAPSSFKSSTVAQHATFDASVTRWNIDSPAKNRPMRTPYRPPTSTPSCHTSTECAQPNSCRRVYASTNDASIQPCGRSGRRSRASRRRRPCSPGARSGRWRAAASGCGGSRRAG